MVIFSHNSIYYNSIYLLLMPRRDTGHASFLYSSPTFGLAKAPAKIFRFTDAIIVQSSKLKMELIGVLAEPYRATNKRR
jgi:hypothetical protein